MEQVELLNNRDVGAMPSGGYVYYEGTRYKVKRAAISASSNGNNTIIAAVPGRRIVVLQAWLVSAGTVTTTWQDGATGTGPLGSLTGAAALVANTGYVLGFTPLGWFETSPSTLLNLSLSAGVGVAGNIVYIEALTEQR